MKCQGKARIISLLKLSHVVCSFIRTGTRALPPSATNITHARHMKHCTRARSIIQWSQTAQVFLWLGEMLDNSWHYGMSADCVLFRLFRTTINTRDSKLSWIALVAAICIQCTNIGFLWSFSIFYSSLLEKFNASKERTGIFFSVQS